jgi:hypothetical protein
MDDCPVNYKWIRVSSTGNYRSRRFVSLHCVSFQLNYNHALELASSIPLNQSFDKQLSNIHPLVSAAPGNRDDNLLSDERNWHKFAAIFSVHRSIIFD